MLQTNPLTANPVPVEKDQDSMNASMNRLADRVNNLCEALATVSEFIKQEPAEPLATAEDQPADLLGRSHQLEYRLEYALRKLDRLHQLL